MLKDMHKQVLKECLRWCLWGCLRDAYGHACGMPHTHTHTPFSVVGGVGAVGGWK